jgi:Bax protein
VYLFYAYVRLMLKILTILLVVLLMTLFSGHAVAYQYGYYSPHPYSAPRAYNNPYARAPQPYYPAYRYPPRLRHAYAPAQLPVQASAANRMGVKAPEQAAVSSPSGAVEVNIETLDESEKTVENGSVLSGKKHDFITTLLPYIQTENRRLTALHNKLTGMFSKLESGVALTTSEQLQISKLANKYRVKSDPLVDITAREEMLHKIDIVPSSLALAQAANESAWGKSRFAQEANNLFGIWTYDQDKGLKPNKREQGKTHLVRIFDDFSESVRYYMYTLNSHPAYKELREIRQQLRASDQIIDGHRLAAGLEKYSAKGQGYIALIQGLIKQNEWAALDTGNQRV